MIICIMGHSGSGKDTVSNMLSEELNFRKIIPVTTRPMRNGERNGIDYFFYDDNYFNEERDNLIAIREFNVWNGDTWKYAFDKRAFNSNDTVVVTTDLLGFKTLKNTFKEDMVIGIFLDVPISTLVKRLKERNTPQKEISRRLVDDMNKYKNFKKEYNGNVPYMFTVRNVYLDKTLYTIKNILKFIKK